MSDNLLPVLLSRIANRDSHQAEVAAGIIDADEELIAVMVHCVFAILLARHDHLPLASRLPGREITPFRGSVAARSQEKVRLATGALQRDVKALVLLFVDQV